MSYLKNLSSWFWENFSLGQITAFKIQHNIPTLRLLGLPFKNTMLESKRSSQHTFKGFTFHEEMGVYVIKGRKYHSSEHLFSSHPPLLLLYLLFSRTAEVKDRGNLRAFFTSSTCCSGKMEIWGGDTALSLPYKDTAEECRWKGGEKKKLKVSLGKVCTKAGKEDWVTWTIHSFTSYNIIKSN